MFYVNINENKFQTSWSENPENAQYLVDCLSLSTNHKLKEYYQDFSGVEQWEIDTEKEFQSKKQELLNKDNDNFSKTRNGILTIDEVPINIDPESSVNISGKILEIMVNRLLNKPALTITWFDDNNLSNEYTEDEFITIGTLTSAYIQDIQAKHSNNVLAINNSITVDDLNAVDVDYAEI